MRLRLTRRDGWILAALLALLALAAVLRLGSLRFHYGHPDEVIAVKVAQGVVARGTLDTNWVHADLPSAFRYPQFNFSGYLLAAAGALQATTWWAPDAAADTLRTLRAFSAILGSLVVGLTFVVGRQWFGAAAGLLAALVVAIQPLLYQDSLYARPETFVTALTLAVLALLGARPAPGLRRVLAAAALVGVLVATKVSMALLAPVLLLGVDWADRARVARTLLAITLAGLLGALAAAPFAQREFMSFVDGVQALRQQYSTGHWPHGVLDGNVWQRLGHAGLYFLATSGLLFLFSFVGVARAALEAARRPLAFFLFAFATALQFSSYPVFFERNLSHVVPVFAIFAAHGLIALGHWAGASPIERRALTAIASLLVLAPSLATTLELRLAELPGKHRRALDAQRAGLEARFGTPSTRIGWTSDYDAVVRDVAFRCGPVLIELPVSPDAASARLLQQLDTESGYQPVARFHGGFASVPPSTLQTYFTPPTAFLYKPLDIRRCRDVGGGMLAQGMVGALLPVLSQRADAGWARAGASMVRRDPFGATDFWGSWAGADAHRGRLELVVLTQGHEFLVLPYVTGPDTRHQTIAFEDADTGRVLLRAAPARSLDWQFPMLRLPDMTRAVRIVATDDGSGWGEWHAIAMPRALKLDATGSAVR